MRSGFYETTDSRNDSSWSYLVLLMCTYSNLSLGIPTNPMVCELVPFKEGENHCGCLLGNLLVIARRPIALKCQWRHHKMRTFPVHSSKKSDIWKFFTVHNDVTGSFWWRHTATQNFKCITVDFAFLKRK